jgi:hypothetical protein
MGWHKEFIIEVCESVEEATGIEFDTVQDHILSNEIPVERVGEWCLFNLSDIWFGFIYQRPIKVVFGNSADEVKKQI